MDPVESALSTIPNARGELTRRPPLPQLEMRITRNRHEPRLCHGCQAPMAGQTDRCWKCGEAWAPKPRAAGQRPSLRDAATQVQEARARRHNDAKRRDRAPTTRAGAATAPRET
jgi:predicted amidophosphoribosyltransferase